MSSRWNEQPPRPFNVRLHRSSTFPSASNQFMRGAFMSSRLRITLGVIQLTFGILLLGDYFWNASARADWKKEWEKTLAAAKKEGQVVLLMRRYEGVFGEFRKEYPEIKVVTITGRGSDLGNRIVAERRAGKFLVDIYVGGPYTVASSLMPAKAVDPISEVRFFRKFWMRRNGSPESIATPIPKENIISLLLRTQVRPRLPTTQS
jgi:hypothetical protein